MRLKSPSFPGDHMTESYVPSLDMLLSMIHTQEQKTNVPVN